MLKKKVILPNKKKVLSSNKKVLSPKKEETLDNKENHLLPESRVIFIHPGERITIVSQNLTETPNFEGY